MKKFLLVSLSAAMLFGSAALAGQTTSVTRHAKVVVGDLDLKSEAGIAVLFERLRSATSAVCGLAPTGAGDQAQFERTSYKTCKDGAWSDAIAKLSDKVPASVLLTAAK